MAFRAEVRRALAAPLGGPLGRRLGAAAGTVIVGDARGEARDEVALAELIEALARAGVPRGRQLVLLAGGEGAPAAVTARRLRLVLGVPVVAHDPAGAHFVAGRDAGGAPIELDDELREAEEVAIAGRFAADAGGRVSGGPAALWPGLAPAAAAATLARELEALPATERAAATLARAAPALAAATVGFALLWSAHDPPRVRAGEAASVFAACVREGWLAARS